MFASDDWKAAVTLAAQAHPDGRLRQVFWCRSAHKFHAFARFLDEKVGRMNIKPKGSRFVRPYREFMHKPCGGALYADEPIILVSSVMAYRPFVKVMAGYSPAKIRHLSKTAITQIRA